MDFKFQKGVFTQLLCAIKNNKGIFALIVILQFISISTFSSILITSSITLAQDLQELTDPLANINYDDPSLSEQEILIQGAKLISAYETLYSHISNYFFQVLLVFFTVPGFIWALSIQSIDNLKHGSQAKSFKQKIIQLAKYYLGYLRTTAVTILPLVLVIVIIAKFMLNTDMTAFVNVMQILSFFMVGLAIITLAALSFSNQKSFKHQYLLSKQLILTKLHYFLFFLIICAIPTGLSVYFLYYTTLLLEHFPLMLLAAFLLMVSISVARFYVILVARSLVHQTK